MKILVTFAGGAGVTSSVADRIARVMTGLGAEVTLLPMSGVITVRGFSAVVAGSIEHGRGWMPEAMEFIRVNQALLKKKPLALFTVIPALGSEKGAESRMVIMQYTAHVRGMVHPVSEGFFTGESVRGHKAEPGERSKFKLRILLGLLKEGEFRSHEAETWAARLHEKLLRVTGKGPAGPVHGA